MSHEAIMYMGRHLDGEGVVEIRDVKSVSISEAANSPTEALRKQEHDAAVAAIAGDATVFTSFGLVEDELQALDARLDAAEALDAEQAIRRVFTSSAWVDGGSGNYYVEVPHTFNSSALTYVLQRDEGAGVWHYMADDEIEVDVDDDKFVLRTISPSVYAHIVRVIATGVVVDVV